MSISSVSLSSYPSMASSAKPFSLFILITLLTTLLYTTHARENQFFNKASTTNTNNNLVPDDDKEPLNNQPDFLPENENGYGLAGHNSVQLPPSATTTESKQPLPKYLPRNYNPVAYVTEPEDTNTFAEEKSYYNNGGGGGRSGGERNYYYSNNNQKQEEEEEEPPYRRSYPNTRSNYYNGGGGGSGFNSEPQGLSDTSFRGGEFQRPQGMSDTRSLENGKYYYDLNTESYNINHPYERLRAAARARNEYSNVNRNNFRGYESNVRDNSVRGYSQNGREDQYFQDEGYNNNLP